MFIFLLPRVICYDFVFYIARLSVLQNGKSLTFFTFEIKKKTKKWTTSGNQMSLRLPRNVW